MITDELREWVRYLDDNPHLGSLTDFGKQALTNLADRIDEQHSVKVERLEKYRAAVNAMLKEYVKLPVDADGVPIRIGDTVKLGDGTFEVRRLELYDMDSWDVLDRFGEPFSPFYMRHVQPDTWEHIIEDAAKLARGDNDAVMELIERCQRLAGEA